jgi:hypothetical protein
MATAFPRRVAVGVEFIMFGIMRFCGLIPVLAILVSLFGSPAGAEDLAWRVTKSSGDVMVTDVGAQPASLSEGALVRPGAGVRTGPNGRALLKRGENTMLIAPNSMVSIPADRSEGLSTTILQQAGSILLNVEKRDVQHFQVETPYLAAVVKGTEFRVSVSDSKAHVDVLRGMVEVSDFRSGQFALVRAEQTASVTPDGPVGLSLSGAGQLPPIQQGSPRQPSGGLLPAAKPEPAAEKRANAPEFRLASVPVVPEPAPVRSGNTPAANNWLNSLFGLDPAASGTPSRNRRSEDLTLVLGVPGAIGLAVFLFAALRRRREQDRNGKNPQRR